MLATTASLRTVVSGTASRSKKLPCSGEWSYRLLDNVPGRGFGLFYLPSSACHPEPMELLDFPTTKAYRRCEDGPFD